MPGLIPPRPRPAADAYPTVDQEAALRESSVTGEWHPQDVADRATARELVELGLLAPDNHTIGRRNRYYLITPAGTDWLQTHPEVS